MQKEISVKDIQFNQKYVIDEAGRIWSPYGGGKYLCPSPTKKGEEIASHNKLTEKEVLEICELLINSNLSLAKIGEKYGVSRYCIFDIKRKKSWKWLTEDYNF